MSEPKQAANEDIASFHEIVRRGSLDDLAQALEGVADVNAAGHMEQTALMLAIGSRDLRKMKLLLEQGADPERTDAFNGTALRHAVECDYADGVRLLLNLGVDRGYHPKYAPKKVVYDDDFIKLSQELGQLMPDQLPIISEVQCVEVLELFLQAGDDLNLAPTEVKRIYIGLRNGGDFHSTLDDYRSQRSPRYATGNPERMDSPFWNDMVRMGVSAYAAREHFEDTDPFRQPGAVWCFDRFGSSLTRLPDGRFVQIGGEHEDHYDPDFHIYNDVVIHDGKGRFQILGYPKEDFPSTDFHTATLVGEGIYIIGCLGYVEQREAGRTPVYRLKLESWEIEPVKCSGEMPGWIRRHRAIYEAQRNMIRVEAGSLQVAGDGGDLTDVSNKETFELDLATFQWRRVKFAN